MRIRLFTPLLLLALLTLIITCGKDERPAVKGLGASTTILAQPNKLSGPFSPPKSKPILDLVPKPAGPPVIIPRSTNIRTATFPNATSLQEETMFEPNIDTFETQVENERRSVPEPMKIISRKPIKQALRRRDNSENISYLSTLHGLTSPLVHALCQDHDGNIWIGNYAGGLFKYDGNFITRYHIAYPQIKSIHEDQQNNIWVGTAKGALRYDGHNVTFFGKDEGLIHNDIVSISEDKQGNLWFASLSGIAKFDGQAFINFIPEEIGLSPSIRCSFADRYGNQWFGGGSGISRFDGTNFYHRDLGLSSGDWVTCLDQALNGDLWIGTNRGVFHMTADSLYDFSHVCNPSHDNINDLFIDRLENLWLCSGSGVYRYSGGMQDLTQPKIAHFGIAEGFSDEDVVCGLEDRNGILWFGTNNGGLNRYLGDYFRHIQLSNVRQFQGGHGTELWAVTFGTGIFKIEESRLLHYQTSSGLTSDFLQSIAIASDSTLWIGTWGDGVDIFDGSSVINLSMKNGLSGNYILNIFEDDRQRIWISTNGGISRYNHPTSPDEKPTLTHFGQAQGFSDDWMLASCQSGDGSIWFGTIDGLIRYDGEAIHHYENFNQSFPGNILSIVEDTHGDIWIGTNEFGLIKFDGESFTRYGMTQGLTSNTVNSLLITSNEDLWAGGPQGLHRIELGGEQLNFKTALQYEDGFLGIGTNFNSLVEDVDGNIWAGTINHISQYYPDKYIPDTTSPTINLTDISLSGRLIDWRSMQEHKIDPLQEHRDRPNTDLKFDSIVNWTWVPAGLDVPPSAKDLTFHVVGINTKKPGSISYRYQLQGLDEHWSQSTISPSVTYTNLPHGNFTLKAVAITSEGVRSNELSFDFTIRPPWWHTWWAYLTYACLFLILLHYLDSYQKGKVIAKERQKARDRELAQANEIKMAYTKLKTTQAQLIQSEKMASLGELTAGIAHEIQNPLNFVNNFSEVSSELISEAKQELKNGELKEAQEILDDLDQNLEKINHHGQRASGIVKGMLDHSRTTSGEKIPTNINKLCDEYIRLAYHGMRAKDKSFNVAYETDLQENIPEINIVPQDIGRVILNLVNNAFQAVSSKALAKEGQEKTKAEAEDYQPLVMIKTELVGGLPGFNRGAAEVTTGVGGPRRLQITISDNGPGIPDDIKDKIFQPFFTTKPTGQGTGLGLSLSYDIIKAHGGDITLSSNPNIGTTFFITLPTHSSNQSI